jgi:hypothetical protein
MIVVDLRRLTSFDQAALGMRQLIAHNRLDGVLDIRGTVTGEAP